MTSNMVASRVMAITGRAADEYRAGVVKSEVNMSKSSCGSASGNAVRRNVVTVIPKGVVVGKINVDESVVKPCDPVTATLLEIPDLNMLPIYYCPPFQEIIVQPPKVEDEEHTPEVDEGDTIPFGSDIDPANVTPTDNRVTRPLGSLINSMVTEPPIKSPTIKLSLKRVRNVTQNMRDGDMCTKVLKTEHAVDVKTEVPLYACKFCPKVYQRRDCYYLHLAQHKVDLTGQHVYRCDICFKTYVSFTRFQYHQLLHQKYPPSLAEPRVELKREFPFECNVCSRKFSRNCHLARHSKVHNPTCTERIPKKKKSTEFACHICGDKYDYLFEFQDHMNTHLT